MHRRGAGTLCHMDWGGQGLIPEESEAPTEMSQPLPESWAPTISQQIFGSFSPLSCSLGDAIEAAGLGKGAECRSPELGHREFVCTGLWVSLWLLGTSCAHVTTPHVSVSRDDVGSTEGGDQLQCSRAELGRKFSGKSWAETWNLFSYCGIDHATAGVRFL